jgi:hypothetical protein
MGQLMKCDCGGCGGCGGGRETPINDEIRNTQLGFLKISIFKLQPILF